MGRWTRREVLKSGIASAISFSALQNSNSLTAPGTTDGNLPGNPLQETSPGSMGVGNLSGAGRERLLLDFGWCFQFGHATDPNKDFGYTGQDLFSKTGGMFPPSHPRFDDSGWKAVDIPHDWAVELPFKNDPKLETHGYKPLGRTYPETSVGWYRRVFEVPGSDLGRRFTIEFEGVFRDSIAVLNGIYLGRHASGYTPVHYDVTDFVNYGGKNILVVRVDATLGEGWFYEGAGIYRHVWLTKTSPVHVAHDGTYITSEVNAGSATVSVAIEVVNDSESPQTCHVVTHILDSGGNTVGSGATAPSPISVGGTSTFKTEISVESPNLWSLEQPNLYKAISSVAVAGKGVDEYKTSFGIRTIQFDADKGFLLNEKPVKIKGTCNHQDFAGVGSALPDRINHFRIERLKEMGSNGYRTSHNPPPPALLDACDRLGMLVMDETRMMSSSPEGLQELAVLIRRDRNHPSVIIWSIGNEEDLIQGNATGARIAESMKLLARKLDPTRPITEAMNSDWGKGLSAVVDVQGFNYGGGEKMDDFHRQFPNQPTIGTETASTVSTRGIYANDKNAGYVSAYDLNYPPWASTAENWWSTYAERPYVSGGFAWTGFDYRGEPTPYSWPCINSHFGIVDTCGFAKDNFYYYQSQWGDKPSLHLFPHWNWAGKEGQEIAVWCYSNLPEVELLVNGKGLGRKDVPRHRHAEWKVPYVPGRLEARAYNGNTLVLTRWRETTGPAAKLVLRPDRPQISADGEDVCLITVEVQDAEGHLVPVAGNNVSFKISGNGRLIGVGNGDPSSHESDKGETRSAFNGLCLAIVQATKTPGDMVVDASSPGLASATATISCQSAKMRPAAAVWSPRHSGPRQQAK
jgi:beta-galactosidase